MKEVKEVKDERRVYRQSMVMIKVLRNEKREICLLRFEERSGDFRSVQAHVRYRGKFT